MRGDTDAIGRTGEGAGAQASPSRRGFGRSAGPLWDDGSPIREELLSLERLEEYARELAHAHAVLPDHARGAPLSRRLKDNEAVLVESYRDVVAAIDAGAPITPAAEWLVDNFHIVEKQIREIRLDLPPGFYRQLPKLANGPFHGYPRVFGVAWAFVAHTDSLFEPDALQRFLRAYQQVQPLTIGELWAVAITLRIVLVENLRRIARRVTDSRAARREADLVADRLLGVGGAEPEPAPEVLPTLTRGAYPDAFLVQLVHRLRDQDPSVAPALEWLDRQAATRGFTPDDVVREEHQRQVAGSVTVRNIITSMRLISDVDWTVLFEKVSLVDDVLAGNGGFRDMDFPTRNLYRTAVEELARGSPLSELEVAEAAVAAAVEAAADPRRADAGYHLIAAGRRAFEARVGYRAPMSQRPSRLYRALGIGGYVGAGALVAALLLAVPVAITGSAGLAPPWLWLLGVLGLIPAIDVAVALVNHLVTRGYRATLLPALDLQGGVPASLRTLVAVPTLLSSKAAIDELVERLEIHFLSSPPGDVHFALLTDWVDADAEHVEADEALLAAAREGVARLNALHGPAPAGDRFLLLHRRRVWNEGERRWLGWERKRGKLAELNRLLRGDRATTYVDPPLLPDGVRYVVTLDSDTRLPRETLGRLVGKMAHPLNRPRLDPVSGRVVEGYAILQPRVTPALPVGREGSLFLKVFSRATGIDPYAAAVSDVYQDLFGEGSFTGKGIYDVDAFEAALAGRVPESTLLSHDLFEGIFARAGLASDVEVVEDFPARYDVAALRHHRWVRGDWQLLPWILGRGPERAARRDGGVPAIGRWKMLDNLRRSVSPPTMLAVLAAAWALGPADAAVWTLYVLATMVVPPLIPLAADVVPRPGVTLRSHLRALRIELELAGLQVLLMLVFLAHQAWLMGDAIARTLVRLFVTRRHLLQWVPSAQAAFGRRDGVAPYLAGMAGAPLLGLAVLALDWVFGRGGQWLAAPFALAWIVSPVVAYRASQSPRTLGRRTLEAEDARSLRLIARRTWRFFETFVTAEEHMLPPDNFQASPNPVVAHRTSPTNIGLYLLSTACARDLGWIAT
ncbi:MAG TPA: glycosyl transferase, partial [Caulobacteraceae bacterium]|nr:glycosyl transferase [Caulobacteraceae bacterium]